MKFDNVDKRRVDGLKNTTDHDTIFAFFFFFVNSIRVDVHKSDVFL